MHHIFPKALLYQHGYSKADVNAIANLTFLTQDTNLRVADRDPAEYLEAFARKHPGAVASHWIPMERDLWRVENYHAFLAARRELLAEAANLFLDSLLAGVVPESATSPSGPEQRVVVVSGGVESEEEEQLIQACNAWVVQHGLPAGEYLYELTDALTGEPLAVLDLAWPSGLQEGYSQPVALLIGASQETEEAANRAGYRYFTDVHAFRAYLQQEILALPSASQEELAAQRDRRYTKNRYSISRLWTVEVHRRIQRQIAALPLRVQQSLVALLRTSKLRDRSEGIGRTIAPWGEDGTTVT